MPPTISDFRAISTGTHNVGDVLLDNEKGGLKKVNNFVSRWRVERNNTVASAQENMAVRKALYNALMADGRVSKPVMDAIKNQLLGENEVRALKRDEVAVYLAAADTNSAEGLDDRIKELRERKIGDAGNRPIALKSKSDVAMKLSVNEKLDMARMKLQKARVECEDILLARHSGKPVADMINKFANNFKKLCADFARAMTPDGGDNMPGLNLEFKEDDFANHQTMCDTMCGIIDTLMLDGDIEGVKSMPIRRELKSAFTFGSVDGLAPSTYLRYSVVADELDEPQTVMHNMKPLPPRQLEGLHYRNQEIESPVAQYATQVFQVQANRIAAAVHANKPYVSQNKWLDVGRGCTVKLDGVTVGDDKIAQELDRSQSGVNEKVSKSVADWFGKAKGNPKNNEIAMKLFADFAYQKMSALTSTAAVRFGEPMPNNHTIKNLRAQDYNVKQESDDSFVFSFRIVANMGPMQVADDAGEAIDCMFTNETLNKTEYSLDISFKLSFDKDGNPVFEPISMDQRLDIPDEIVLFGVDGEVYRTLRDPQTSQAPRVDAPAAAQTNTIIEGGFAGKTLEVSGVNTEAARYMQNELQAEAMTIKEEIDNGTPLDDKQMYRDAGRDAILKFNGEVISQPFEYGNLQGLQDGEKRKAMKPMSDRLDACFSNDPNGEFARRFFRKLSQQNTLGMCLEALEKQYGVYTAPDNLPRKGGPKPVVVYEMKSLENGGYEYSVEYRGRPKVLDVNNAGVTINPDGGEMSYRMDLELTFDDKGNPNIRTTECRSRIYVPQDVQPEIGEEFVDEAQKECLWGSPIGSPRTRLNVLRENGLKDLQNAFPITSADHEDAIEKANETRASLVQIGERFPDFKVECDEMIHEIDARVGELERGKARKLARPQSYRNVREGLREWCKVARHVYTSTLALRTNDANAKPNPALIGELYMEMAAFDDVKDLDADCPDAKKLLKKGLDQLAHRLVRVFKRHGIDMDLATARYAMQIHFNYQRDYSEGWKEHKAEVVLASGGHYLDVKSTATPAHLIQGNTKYVELPSGKKGLNCTTFTGSRAVNAWQSTFEVGGEKFVGMRHGVNCAIKEADPEKRRECNLARAEELFVGAALSSALVQDAKDGEAVTLDMTSVSLLTPDVFRNVNGGFIDNERQMLDDQTEAWRALQEKYGDGTAGLALSVPMADGNTKTVHVKLDLIAFNFGVNWGAVAHTPADSFGGWNVSDKINKPGMLKLSERVDKYLNSPVDEKKKNLVRTLFNQVKDILARKDERRDGHNAYKVPMRINVLTSLMNGIPAWNCKSGKDRTGALEVWTQLLYQKIMSGQDIPDPNDPPTEEDIANFRKLAVKGNNFEIQQANTVFGGFKTKKVASFKEILGSEEALNGYYGASDLVNE